MGQLTRREILQRGGIGTAAVISAHSAGCLELLSISGSGSPAYTEWLFVPESSTKEYEVMMIKPASLREHRSHLSDTLASLFKPSTSLSVTPSSIDFGDLKTYMYLNKSIITIGPYDSSEMIQRARQEDGYTNRGEYEGYTLFERSLGGIVAISDTAVIESYTSTQQVKTIIDTKSGSKESYVEQNKNFGTLTEHLGTGELLTVGQPLFDGSLPGTVGGEAATVEGETSQLTVVAVFDTEGSADQTEVENYLSSTAYGTKASDVSYSQDSHVITAEATIQTKDLGP